MPQVFDLDEFTKGLRYHNPSFRRQLNAMVRAIEQQPSQPGTFYNGAMTAQYPYASGVGVESLSTFAIVTVEVEESEHTLNGIDHGAAGKVVLLDENMQATVQLDPVHEDYDSELVSEAEIEVWNLSFVKMPVGTIVELKSNVEIEVGTEGPVWARFVTAMDELQEMPGGGAVNKSYHSGTTPEGQGWLGGVCTPP